MQWFLNKNGENTGELFDDGVLMASPGDEGFTQDFVRAECAKRGPEWTFDFANITWPPLPPADPEDNGDGGG